MSGNWRPDTEPRMPILAAREPLGATISDALGQDALQTLLAQGDRNRLHAHNCRTCGARMVPCRQLPCAFRPFDRNAEGREWECGFCRAVREVVREDAGGVAR